MGEIQEPLPVKLIASMFTNEMELFERAKAVLIETFGPVDYESGLLPFDHTAYYRPEFGEGLMRRFVTFARLIDPGHVSSAKLVLATTKNRAHRIYLGSGIFAEVTLHYHKKTFRAWEWTYPDYASSPYIAIFNHIRGLYMRQLKGSQKQV